jgi:hypothetical protein
MICAEPGCRDDSQTVWMGFCLCSDHLEMAYEAGRDCSGEDLMDLISLVDEECSRCERAGDDYAITSVSRRVRALWDGCAAGEDRVDVVESALLRARYP